jgi:hypothetical protein
LNDVHFFVFLFLFIGGGTNAGNTHWELFEEEKADETAFGHCTGWPQFPAPALD